MPDRAVGHLPRPARHGTAVSQSRKIVQFLLIHAVRTRTYYQSDNLRMRQRLLIKRLQTLQRGICIRKRLEICKIMLSGAIPHHMELDPLIQLLMQALSRRAI